jgi:hypothetical protein
MHYENYYIEFLEELNIYSISKYKNIILNFVNKFINKNINNYENKNNLYEDSLIYSKYYLYYKTMNCVYSEEIMNILFEIDYIKNS